MKYILKYILLMSLVLSLFPVLVVSAENENTYTILAGNECLLAYKNNGYKYYFSASTDVRICLFKYANNSTNTVRVMVSQSPFTYSMTERTANNTNTCPATNVNNSVLYNGYYVVASRSSTNITNITDVSLPVNGPQSSSLDIKDVAIYYTYGEGAVGPTPTPEPTNWGQLRDVSYSTNIAGGGQAAKQNIDVLSWEKSIDTNGNDISECEVEIRAVPGNYSGSTMQELLNKVYNEFDTTGVQPVTLDTVSAGSGSYSVSWNDIINTLNWNLDFLFARLNDNLYEKYGWYYQIRLINDAASYTGQWQTLYTATSTSAQGSENIINSNTYNVDIYQAIEEITVANNNTTITITYNDTDITVQNPSDGTEPSGGTSLWDLLKLLISGIFQIIAKIGDLIGDLFGLLRDLITPPESIQNEVNQVFELNINNYLQNDQTEVHELYLAIDQFRGDLRLIAQDYANNGLSAASCYITWEDVTIDLTVFGAGSVTFIPGGSYDFGSLFDDIINAFGFSYDQYRIIVSGVIYIFLIVFIYKHILRFLNRS